MRYNDDITVPNQFSESNLKFLFILMGFGYQLGVKDGQANFNQLKVDKAALIMIFDGMLRDYLRELDGKPTLRYDFKGESLEPIPPTESKH